MTTNKEWEKEFYRRFQEEYPNLTDEQSEEIKSFISTLLKEALEEERRKYDDIFSWLLGEKGGFPDLSQKPHYRFRTELREKIKSLQ